MKKNKLLSVATVCCLSSALPAHAHHSFAEYEENKTIEVQGKLVEALWQNPHVHFKVEVTDSNGRITTWDAESNSLSILRRTNATPESLKTGDTVKIAGWPSRRSASRMFVTNLLPRSGRELVLDMRSKPRWASDALGTQTTWMGGGTATTRDATIFHVWSTNLADLAASFPWRDPNQYPLTDSAKKALAKWDPVRDTVASGCEAKGMPTILEQPYPMELVDKGDTILMRLEEYDTVRTIHMRGDDVAGTQPKTRLGYSTGHWDGKTLVVNTSRINWRYFDPSGVPQGPDVSIVERFTQSADGSTLTNTFTVTDPATFTRPLELKRVWVRRPGDQVKPYNCVSEAKTARK